MVRSHFLVLALALTVPLSIIDVTWCQSGGLRRLPPSDPSNTVVKPASAEIGPGAVAPKSITTEIIETGPGDIGFHDPWYSPGTWYDPEIWSGSFEIGLNGTEGNSQSLSMRTGGNLERKTDDLESSIKLSYARTTANSVETQHNATLKVDQNWLFGNSPWTVFAKEGVAYDEFKPFDMRLILNSGVGYRFLKSDTITMTGRFGAGTSREFGGPDDSWTPEAVFGMDWNHQLTRRQKLVAKMDYFPEWSNFEDYRLELDAGWEMLIDAEANLSLKLSIVDRYDSTPNGAKNNDIDYALLLLWKL